MQAAVDRVMETFGMIEKLTADEEKVARRGSPAIFRKGPRLTTERLLLRACGICEALGT